MIENTIVSQENNYYTRIETDLSKRLNNNREETLANVTNFINDKTINPSEIDFEAKRKDLVHKSATVGSYTEAIDKLQEANDARNHISWRVVEGHSDETKDLIRDARAVKVDTTEYPEKYAAQYLNLCRAAERIIDSSESKEKDKLKQAIKNSAKDLLTSLSNDEITTPQQVGVKERTSYLVAILDKAGVKDPGKTLVMAKDFQFEDEHRHITTISMHKDASGNEVPVAESSVMALGTIPEIQAMYDAVKNNKQNPQNIPRSLEHNGETYSMDWYHKASNEVQKQILANIDEIASGNKVIMNQLIDVLPGAKNCYEKTTLILNNDGTEKSKMSTMHSGAPSFHGKGNQKEITRLQVRQLNSFKESGVDIITLNSKARITENIERNIENYVKDAVKDEGRGRVSVAPFNILRYFTPRDNTVFKEALKTFAQQLNEEKLPKSLVNEQRSSIKDLKNYLEERPNFFGRAVEVLKDVAGIKTKAEKAQEGVIALINENEELAKSCKTALNAAKLIDSIDILDRNNKSSKISAEIITLSSNQEYGIKETLTHCKSGIDRTGTVMAHATHSFISRELGINDQDKSRDSIITQTAAGHSGFIAGAQAGTIGAHGVKPETSHQFSQDVFHSKNKDGVCAAELLSKKSATGNKGKYDKSLAEKLKENVDKALEVVKEKIKDKTKNLSNNKTQASDKTNNFSAPVQITNKEQNKTLSADKEKLIKKGKVVRGLILAAATMVVAAAIVATAGLGAIAIGAAAGVAAITSAAAVGIGRSHIKEVAAQTKALHQVPNSLSRKADSLEQSQNRGQSQNQVITPGVTPAKEQAQGKGNGVGR